MEIRFMDSETGKLHKMQVAGSKLTMQIIEDDGKGHDTAWLLKDLETAQAYALAVSSGKLIMYDTGEVTDCTKLVIGDCVMEIRNGRLFMREVKEGELVVEAAERSLIDYLPIFISEYAEIRAITGAEQADVETAWKGTKELLYDQFVVDATEYGVRRWERIFNISPKETYTLEERKFDILVKLNEQQVYTMRALKSVLASICGENNYSVMLDHEQYLLSVKLSLSSGHHLEAVKNFLHSVVPANLVIIVSTFNIHDTLHQLTHGELAAYTQKEVRETTLTITR